MVQSRYLGETMMVQLPRLSMMLDLMNNFRLEFIQNTTPSVKINATDLVQLYTK